MSRRGTATSPHSSPPVRVPGELADQQPQNGDLIISRRLPPHEGFGISQAPGGVQLSVSRRAAAAELAREFAQRQRVDLWEQCDDTCSLVDSYRRTRKAATGRDAP